jgi:hypothetical protein
MLTLDELAQMRSTVEAAFPDQMVRQIRTLTATGDGGSAVSWSSQPAVACRLEADQAPERFREMGTLQEANVHFPVSATLLASDRVVIGGVRFEVLEVLPLSQWGLNRTARLRRAVEVLP